MWISVKERLPESKGAYLVYWWDSAYRENKFRVAEWDMHDWYISNTGPYRMLVTHWMPLPDPPASP